MTKPDAIFATAKKFTNLMDGKVIPNIGVMTIINYYESLLDNKIPDTVNSASGIMSNFQEEENQELLNEADYWDGEHSREWEGY
jgi:hypothetical protein